MSRKVSKLVGVVVLFLIACLLMAYSYYNAMNIVRTDYTISTNKVSREYKVLLISDLHYGVVQDKKSFNDVLDDIKLVNPDIVILAGDIVQAGITSKSDMLEVMELLGSIDSKHGIYYVIGNHDTVSDVTPEGDYESYSEEDLCEALNNNGISLLDGEHAVTDDITLIGRHDLIMYLGGVRPLVEQTNTGGFTILVDHRPYEVDSAYIECDLRLSGHTHGGQVFPVNLYFSCMGEYVYGRHSLSDGSTLIITSGAGVGKFPLRNLEHCEYVVITIKPE